MANPYGNSVPGAPGDGYGKHLYDEGHILGRKSNQWA